jgi:hypothetical protein
MEDNQQSDGLTTEQLSRKKVVHWDDNADGHIELKDLTEKDFLDLIDAKN